MEDDRPWKLSLIHISLTGTSYLVKRLSLMRTVLSVILPVVRFFSEVPAGYNPVGDVYKRQARRYMYGVIPDLEIGVQHINFSIHFGPHFTFQIQMLEIAI